MTLGIGILNVLKITKNYAVKVMITFMNNSFFIVS